MEKVEILGALIETDGANMKVIDGESTITGLKASCNGNACEFIDYQRDESTKSYHFFNGGDRTIAIKVYYANYFGCSSMFKTRRIRPGQEWDSGYYGICNLQSNYV